MISSRILHPLLAWISCLIAAPALAQSPELAPLAPDRPNAVLFPAAPAKFVRFTITESTSGQPCLDELEIFASAGGPNLALAASGAKATASSCLPGHLIHQVNHLNDGLFGNGHSWIAARDGGEWAQIELPRPAAISKIVFSRDREGRYKDRFPVAFEVSVSLDGTHWKTVARTGTSPALPMDATWNDRLRYAFLHEQRTWSRVDPDDGLTRVLKQYSAMIDRFAGRGLDVSAERAELTRLRQSSHDEAAYLAARAAKRQLFLRDPDLAPIGRLLFVKRHPYEPSHNYSDILDAKWRPGGGVCVLEIPQRNGRLEPEQATSRTLYDAKEGVARDPMASFDGGTVYFAWRGAPDAYFHLFSVGVDGSGLRQCTDGAFHDYYPCPLPDGGLAFISTRCKARFLCWRPQAFVLFRLDASGDIQPLSFANLSEWAPSVMQDGRILWTRSEYVDKGADFGHTLWAIRPDGTHPELVFGNNTPNCYVNAREVPGTRELCATLISHGGDLNGPIGLINPDQGRSNPEAVTNITPDSPPHYNMNWARRECFRDPVPLSRDLFLCAHAPQNHFGLYVVDRWGNRELIYLDPAISSVCPSPLRPQVPPPVLASTPKPLPETSTGPAPDDFGEFFVQDVYRGLEPAVHRGDVRYLRVCQEVRADLEPTDNGEYRRDHPDFQDWYATPIHKVNGPFGWPSYVAKASLGLVPVAQDGSVRFRAPAGKVLYFEVLDGNLNEIQRMRSVVQLQPGETRSCIGCHEHRASTGSSSARPPLALTQAAQSPAAPPWGAVPFSYERVVQPVLDARCVSCHNATDKQNLNLAGTLDEERVPASYRTLISQGWVHYFDMTYRLRHEKAEPLSFGVQRSRLWKVLNGGHHGVQLTADERHALKCWIDLNCPLWPDYLHRPERVALTSAPPRR